MSFVAFCCLHRMYVWKIMLAISMSRIRPSPKRNGVLQKGQHGAPFPKTLHLGVCAPNIFSRHWMQSSWLQAYRWTKLCFGWSWVQMKQLKLVSSHTVAGMFSLCEAIAVVGVLFTRWENQMKSAGRNSMKFNTLSTCNSNWREGRDRYINMNYLITGSMSNVFQICYI